MEYAREIILKEGKEKLGEGLKLGS